MVYPDQLLTEARAEIIWGENPEAVLTLLRERGLGEKSAHTLIDQLTAERAVALRNLTLAKITHGILLLLSPLAAFFIILVPGILFRDSDSAFLMLLGIILGVLFNLTIGLALIGLWKIVNGLVELLRPSPTIDLADYEE
jgi:hypothetical protein